MKTIQEQIAVMQHFADGGRVERMDYKGDWHLASAPVWDWHVWDYRIAEEVDPYSELKLAAADPTKQIRLLDERGRGDHGPWQDAGYGRKWVFPPEEYEIRDKPKPMKKVKLLAWFTGERLVWVVEEYTVLSDWKRVPSEDKEIEVADD